MFLVIFAVVLAVAAVAISAVPSHQLGNRAVKGAVQGVLGLLAVFCILSTSFTIVGPGNVGHLIRVYGGSSMPAGAVIATNGEKGPQAEILPPGFNFRLMLNIFYDVEELPITVIPPDHYGLITTKDGRSLEAGAVIATAWAEEEFEQMLDANFFLTGSTDGTGARNSKGQKGVQLSVLTPGSYRLNRYLFDVQPKPMTDIAAGFVGVVKSNIQEVPYNDADVAAAQANLSEAQRNALAVPLVPKGYFGIWNEPLLPGKYPLNELAYRVTEISTLLETWEYKGGYTRRIIDLEFGEDGSIKQIPRSENIPVPQDAADKAIMLRLEGWEVPQEARILAQVQPNKAPFVVASVGTIEAVENKVVTPAIRSALRNETGRRVTNANGDVIDRPVLSLINDRAEIEREIEEVLREIGDTTGVVIKEVRLGEPGIPPELLVASRREQIAGQFIKTFQQEKAAQTERIKTEKERATADQQPKLVEAEIAKQAAEFLKDQKALEGEGEKLRLVAEAEGQQAQAQVLGEDRVFMLNLAKELLATIEANPELTKFNVPQVLIIGEGTGPDLQGAMAVLGKSLESVRTPQN